MPVFSPADIDQPQARPAGGTFSPADLDPAPPQGAATTFSPADIDSGPQPEPMQNAAIDVRRGDLAQQVQNNDLAFMARAGLTSKEPGLGTVYRDITQPGEVWRTSGALPGEVQETISPPEIAAYIVGGGVPGALRAGGMAGAKMLARGAAESIPATLGQLYGERTNIPGAELAGMIAGQILPSKLTSMARGMVSTQPPAGPSTIARDVVNPPNAMPSEVWQRAAAQAPASRSSIPPTVEETPYRSAARLPEAPQAGYMTSGDAPLVFPEAPTRVADPAFLPGRDWSLRDADILANVMRPRGASPYLPETAAYQGVEGTSYLPRTPTQAPLEARTATISPEVAGVPTPREIVPKIAPGRPSWRPEQVPRETIPNPAGATPPVPEGGPPPAVRPGGVPESDIRYLSSGPTPPTSMIPPERQTPAYAPFTGSEKIGQVLPTALRPTVREQLAGAWQGLKQNLGEKFKFEYDLNRAGFAKLVDDIRTQVIPARRRALEMAHNDLSEIVSGLANKDELLAFRDIAVLRDLAERGEKGLPLPRGLTTEEVQNALDWRMNNATPEAIAAADKWKNLATSNREELIARGKLGPEQGFNDYFPHQVIDYAAGGMDLAQVGDNVTPAILEASRAPQGSGRARIAYRDYTQQARGSLRDIDTDPLRPIFKHLANYHYQNQLDDFVGSVAKTYDRSGDILPEVRAKYNRPEEWRPDPGERFNVGGRWYEAWQPNPNGKAGETLLPRATTPVEQAIEQVVGKNLPGEGPRATYLLPIEVVERMDKLQVPQEMGGFIRAMNRATRAWKALTIPFGGVSWNVMNLMGDMVNLYRADAAAMKNIPMVAKDYWRAVRQGNVSDFVKLAQEMDIPNASWMGSEVGKFAAMKEYQQFAGDWGKFMQPARNALAALNDAMETREASTRLAHFYQNLERIRNSGEPKTELRLGKDTQGNFIVTKGTEEAMKALGLPMEEIDKVRWAAKNAREFTVDYAKFTDFENKVMRGFLAPFYAWARQNTPNWFTYIARNPGEYAVKFLSFQAAAAAYNNVVFPDTEGKLPDYQRKRFHIILPYKDKTGRQLIAYLPGDPLQDALSWVGLDSAAVNLADVIKDRIQPMDAAMKQLKDLATSPVQNAANLMTPFIKAPMEGLANKSFLSGAPLYPEDYRKYPALMAPAVAANIGESLVRPMRETGKISDAFRRAAFRGETPMDVVTAPNFRYGLGLPLDYYDPLKGGVRSLDTPRIDMREQTVVGAVKALRGTKMYQDAPDAARRTMEAQVIRDMERRFSQASPAPVNQGGRLMLNYR